jgi:DNA polymerase elongation subunit (family B)
MSGTPRILTLDIETAPMLAYTWGLFDQNIGISQIVEPTRVICWAAKWRGAKKVYFASEHGGSRADMVGEIHDLMSNADIVQHYNGTTFDMPHLRREFKGFDLGPNKPVQEIDLYRLVRSRFKFASNKLDYVAQALGVGGKVSHTGFDLWRKCLDGDDKAWALMEKYNKNDVVITEDVGEEVRPFAKTHPHMGLFGLSGRDSCSNCEGTDLEKRGYAYTGQSVFQQYKCRQCGAWPRSTKSVERVSTRASG